VKIIYAIPALCGLALLGFAGWFLWLHAAVIWQGICKVSSFLLFWATLILFLRVLWHLGSMFKRKAQP
jgi:hypothetical protein